MSNPKIYFNEVNERQAVFHRRAFLMAGVAGVGLAALGTRLGYLQLVEADKYKVLSLNNEFQSRLQPPPRGLILDRNGVVLASNRPTSASMSAATTTPMSKTCWPGCRSWCRSTTPTARA